MISLLFLPISFVFILVQFSSRVSLPIPPEPPDWVAVQSTSLKLPLCVTTEGIVTTPYLDMHSFSILIIVLQMFAEMSMCKVVVWNANTSWCTYNMFVVVEFDLSKELKKIHIVHGNYTLFTIISLCSLKFWNFGRHIHFVVQVGLYSKTCAQVDFAFDLFKDIHLIGNRLASYNISSMLIVRYLEPLNFGNLLVVLGPLQIKRIFAKRIFTKFIEKEWIFFADSSILAFKILNLMTFTLRCCVWILEPLVLLTTKSINWISSQLPMELYVKQEIAWLRDAKISSRRLTFETDRNIQRALNLSLDQNLHIEFFSFFVDWLEYVFVMLRDMSWDCFYSPEVSSNIISVLDIVSNSLI
jgi:hypothetical protein